MIRRAAATFIFYFSKLGRFINDFLINSIYFSLDMHYYMSSQIQRRADDGIHWNPDGVRYQTIVFLTHFCLSRQLGR